MPASISQKFMVSTYNKLKLAYCIQVDAPIILLGFCKQQLLRGVRMQKNIKPKVVNKPWGEELWIADGVATPYALKKITFLAGKRSSLHVHQMKIETNVVIHGDGFFEISKNRFQTAKYLELNQPLEMLQECLEDISKFEIKAGDTITVEPGFVHRVSAKSDLIFIECSSCELADVVRLADDSLRGNGKIESEHRD
jgi:quercetin dioxygenase-like cupin family protein